MDQSPSKTSIVHERVRWADVDLVGIMRFSAFTRLIELAEQELMREAGLPYETLFTSTDVWLPRRKLTIEYFAPVRIDDLLEVESFVAGIGETSLTYHVDIRKGDLLVASASLVVVCVAVSDFAKVPLQAGFREVLGPYLGSPDAVRNSRRAVAAGARP